jgi:hypothetical protein
MSQPKTRLVRRRAEFVGQPGEHLIAVDAAYDALVFIPVE